MSAGSVSALHLTTTRAAWPARATSASAVDPRQEPLPQVERRDHDPLRPGAMGIAGEEVEELAHLAREERVGGQQAEVLVLAGGGGVVVARADVDVASDRLAVAAHDEDELACVFSPPTP